MDGNRFDLLTRTLANAISRRTTLGGLAGGVYATLELVPAGTTLSKKKGGKKGNNKKKRKGKKNKQKCNDGNPIRCGENCCRTDQTCRDGRCLHHCEDGVVNFGETDIDCGRVCDGVLAPSNFGRCRVRQRCESDIDCRSGICRDVPALGRVCVECLIDAQCGNLSPTPRCIQNFCFECAADFDCPQERPRCIAASDCPNGAACACAVCRLDADCPEGQLCDSQGRCEGFACESNQDCPTGRACEDGACTGTCVPPGGDITDEGECCADVACVIGDADICCDFGQTCVGSGAEERCG